jgi:hypothetical protein
MLSEEEKAKIREKIRKDLERREQRDSEEIRRRALEAAAGVDLPEQMDESQLKAAEIQKVKKEEEDRFYRENPNYTQYLDRYGQKKWIHRKLFEEKRRKSIERSRAKREAQWADIRKYGLFALAIIMVMAAIWVYRISQPKRVLLVKSNVPGASIFIDNLLSSHVTDAAIRRISPGRHKIAVYKAGFETKFVPVVIGKSDTASVYVELDSLPPSELAMRSSFTAENPDEKTPETPKLRTLPTEVRKTKRLPSPTKGNASVFITSNEPDATIYLDGDPIAADINSVVDNIQLGAHTFELRKPGYRSDPSYSLVHFRKPGELISLSFELVRDVPTSLTIKTEPISGPIFLNGRAVTSGVFQQATPIGDYKVGFGEVPGYRTPDPQDISITEISPTLTVTGVYIPKVYVEASLGDDGQLIRRGCQDITVGYYLPDQGAVESFEYGPTIENIKSQGMYYWEMGYAFARRNPSGSDFIEMHFDLPAHYDDNNNIVLELYGYGSKNNYLFHITEVNDLAIDINNKEVVPHFQPVSILEDGKPLGVNSFPIKLHLHQGQNSVRVRTTDGNHCYYYLRRIVVRSTDNC